MTTMSDMADQPPDLQEQLELLARPEQEMSNRGLRAFSDLDRQEVAQVQAVWRRLPTERRIEIVKKLYSLAEDNVDLNYRPIFLSCLDDTEATVRVTAIEGLWEDERTQTMRQLLPLAQDPSSDVRAAAMTVLGRFAYMAVMDELQPDDRQAVHTTLLRVADDTGQPLNVRRCAIESLGYLADSARDAQSVVTRAYEHQDQDVRASAVVAMGRSMRPEWFEPITRELRSTSPVLRFVAAQAVGELGEDGQQLLPRLLPLIEDTDLEVSLMTIWALGQVGGEEGQRALRRLARTGDEPRRLAANAALSEIELGQF
jgi:HEAT repeat protein